MVTVAKASWSQGTRTAVVSPLGAYESITAVHVPWDKRLGVVAFCMGEASDGVGELAETLGHIVGLGGSLGRLIFGVKTVTPNARYI